MEAAVLSGSQGIPTSFVFVEGGAAQAIVDCFPLRRVWRQVYCDPIDSGLVGLMEFVTARHKRRRGVRHLDDGDVRVGCRVRWKDAQAMDTFT